MKYYTKINTDTYRDHRASKNNWEPGTVNDYMHAINGWKTTEDNLKQVEWRLNMFQGAGLCMSEFEGGRPDFDEDGNETYGMSERYHKWRLRKCNTVKYHDRLCDLDRTQSLTGYGWKQGYFSIGGKIEELRKYGYTRVYFSELYDVRQFDRNMIGCYMELWKSGCDTELAAKEYAARHGKKKH